MKNTLVSHFEHVQIYLQENFPEMESLGARVYAFVIVTDIAKSPSIRLVPIYSPTGDVWEWPFAHSLNNEVCYNERFLILIKQISRIRELLSK